MDSITAPASQHFKNTSYLQPPVPLLVGAVAGDCKYMPSHEWVKVEGDTATVGISDFAQAGEYRLNTPILWPNGASPESAPAIYHRYVLDHDPEP